MASLNASAGRASQAPIMRRSPAERLYRYSTSSSGPCATLGLLPTAGRSTTPHPCPPAIVPGRPGVPGPDVIWPYELRLLLTGSRRPASGTEAGRRSSGLGG